MLYQVDSLEIHLKAGENSMAFSRAYSLSDSTHQFIHAVFGKPGQVISENQYFFVSPKFLSLEKPEIEMRVQQENASLLIQLQSPYLVKSLYLYTEQEGFFSDNFFDLLPGEPVEVRFYPASDFLDAGIPIHFMHLQQVF
jgi:beta-mannosidase